MLEAFLKNINGEGILKNLLISSPGSYNLLPSAGDESPTDVLYKSAMLGQEQQKRQQEQQEYELKKQQMLQEAQRIETLAKSFELQGNYAMANYLRMVDPKRPDQAAAMFDIAHPKQEFRADKSLPGGGYNVTPPRVGINQSPQTSPNIGSMNNAQPRDNLNNIDMNESPHERELRQTRESEKPEKTFNQEDKLRDEFRNESKDWKNTFDSFNKIASSAKQETAAGDMSLIFAYMKMLDSGGRVTEGDYANAQDAGNVPQKVLRAYNNAVDGARLTPQMRKEFVKAAGALYKEKKGEHAKLIKNYKGIATRNKLNEENVIMDYEKEKDATSPNPESPFKSKKLEALEAEIKRREGLKRR